MKTQGDIEGLPLFVLEAVMGFTQNPMKILRISRVGLEGRVTVEILICITNSGHSIIKYMHQSSRSSITQNFCSWNSAPKPDQGTQDTPLNPLVGINGRCLSALMSISTNTQKGQGFESSLLFRPRLLRFLQKHK